MRRKFFIALLCFMFVPIVCSQALGASAWYVINDSDTIKYAQDTTTTEYNSAKWSSAATTVNSLKDFFSLSSLIAGDTVYIKDGTFTIAATIEITKDVTVYGGFKDGDSSIDSRTGTTTIKGGTGFSGSVIKISSTTTILLDGLTITGGNNNGNGGGINNLGELTMINCTVSGNKTTGSSSKNGGGVYNNSVLTMTNCTISDNTAYSCGGVYNDKNSVLTMTNCNVSSNKTTANSSGRGGGGVYNGSDGTLIMTNCTIIGNTANTTGDGVYNSNNLRMKNTLVWGSDASKVINNDGGTINATYSAFPSGINVTGITLGDTTQNNIAIASWNTQTSKDVEVDGVTHTVYRIDDNLELSSLEGAGTKTDDTPENDQLGHTRNNPPCIGAVEIVYAPVVDKETLTIDAIEGKSITAQTIEATQGLDITWSTSGTLPEGLLTASADKTFTILGTPKTGTAANSPYTYTVTAKNDADEAQTVVTVNVTAAPAAPVLSCDNALILTEGEKMTDFTITATNANTVTWSSSGTLPNGLTASNKNNTFTITGTPSEGTSEKSPYKYTVTAENTAGKTQAAITIIVNSSSEGSTPVALVLLETDIKCTAQEGIEISAIRVFATKGTDLTWSGSGTLPEGLSISSQDNVFTISGTPVSGTASDSPYTYTVTAANTEGTAEAKVYITVNSTGSGEEEDKNDDDTDINEEISNKLQEIAETGESTTLEAALKSLGLTAE